MVLHAITQMASNGWRALLWCRHIEWKSTAFYVAGCARRRSALWSITLYVPDKAMALLLLGLSPFIIRAIPEQHPAAQLRPGCRSRPPASSR